MRVMRMPHKNAFQGANSGQKPKVTARPIVSVGRAVSYAACRLTRRGGDSNSRYPCGQPVFETGAFSRSATSPGAGQTIAESLFSVKNSCSFPGFSAWVKRTASASPLGLARRSGDESKRR